MPGAPDVAHVFLRAGMSSSEIDSTETSSHRGVLNAAHSALKSSLLESLRVKCMVTGHFVTRAASRAVSPISLNRGSLI